MCRRVITAAGALMVLAGLAAAPSHAAETAAEAPKTEAKPTAAPAKATAANIAQWVKDMDSETFAVREQAVARLSAAGTPAVAPVAKAAGGESLEAATRAVKVLKALLDGDDAKARAAARAALEKLAKDEQHPAGHMAWQALQPAKGPATGLESGRIIIGGNMAVGNVVAIGGGMRVQVTARNVNGNKEIDVEENGRKVKITDNVTFH